MASDLQYEQVNTDEVATTRPLAVADLADALEALAAPTGSSRSKRSKRPQKAPLKEAATNVIANAAALNGNAKGGIDRFGYRAYAEELCDVLKAVLPYSLIST
jgi:hypothetical protein